MAELITQEELCQRTKYLQSRLIARFILWFDRIPAPWTNPHMAVTTDKRGNIVRSKTTGRVVTHQYKGGPGGKREKKWKEELESTFKQLGLPYTEDIGALLNVSILALYPRPTNMPNKKKNKSGEGFFSIEGGQPKDTKPDTDNLRKSICDAMQGHLCPNDAKIFGGPTSKWYVPAIVDGDTDRDKKHKRPGTLIIIDYVDRWNTEPLDVEYTYLPPKIARRR